MVYTSPCFSGECGFCSHCWDDKGNDIRLDSEIMERARDLSKFFGPKKIDRITMNFNSKLKKWCKERG